LTEPNGLLLKRLMERADQRNTMNAAADRREADRRKIASLSMT
jgi:hypothetical protein